MPGFHLPVPGMHSTPDPVREERDHGNWIIEARRWLTQSSQPSRANMGAIREPWQEPFCLLTGWAVAESPRNAAPWSVKYRPLPPFLPHPRLLSLTGFVIPVRGKGRTLFMLLLADL